MILPSPLLFFTNLENEYCPGVKISGNILTLWHLLFEDYQGKSEGHKEYK